MCRRSCACSSATRRTATPARRSSATGARSRRRRRRRWSCRPAWSDAVAGLVAAMAMTRSPGLTGWFTRASEDYQQQARRATAEMRRRLEAARPDVLVMFSNDHLLNWPINNVPEYTVGIADEHVGPAEWFDEWLAMEKYRVPGHAALARWIVNDGARRGLALAYLRQMQYDDGISVPTHYLNPDAQFRLIPVTMNCTVPPIPTPERAYRVWTLMREILRAHPGNERIAVIATGGLSHEPGGPRYFWASSTHADVLGRGPFRGHPLTGPVSVRGAQRGHVLTVEILDVKPAAPFGWTAIRPGRGLMPEAEFSKPHLTIWDLSDGTHARMSDNVAVPLSPFPGVMGVALDEPGSHSTMPPRKNGGNMDVKHLVAGTTLFLPVWVDGALFSVGDAHAAQGDGEVCVTAVEMMGRVTLRFGLAKGRELKEPQFRTRGSFLAAADRGPCFVTTAAGPDLFAGAQQAIRYMIEHLVTERGLSREQAYIVCSVAVDLKISEIVDAPNWIVSAFLPESIFA